ncbi:MAG: BsuPI-related putative proteinase inhibitor [Gemmatimonadales bacterium]|nr:BsuPI-related putative proteinase inhibitor [Gemmatimonadales bacterium]
MFRVAAGTLLAALVASCGTIAPAPGAELARLDGQSLIVTLSVDKMAYSAGETVVATLVVTNRTAAPVLLRFSTTQRYDFAITDQAGNEVWRWGADMMFGQAIGEETIEPGGRLTYPQRFRAPALAGTYRLAGRFVAIGRDFAASADLAVTR